MRIELPAGPEASILLGPRYSGSLLPVLGVRMLWVGPHSIRYQKACGTGYDEGAVTGGSQECLGLTISQARTLSTH